MSENKSGGFVDNLIQKASQLSQQVVPENSNAPNAKKPMNPCKCWGKNLTLRDCAVAVAVAVICIGLANLVGIYFFPARLVCRESLRLQFDLEYVGDENPPKRPTPPKEDDIKTRCDVYRGLYIAGNVLFLLFSVAAGALLLLAIIKRSAIGALLSTVLLIVALLLILMQTAAVYNLSLARFATDKATAEAEYHTDHPNKQCDTYDDCKPVVGLTGQKALSIIGGIVFFALYLYFAFCAFVFFGYIKTGIDMQRAPESKPGQVVQGPAYQHQPPPVQHMSTPAVDSARPSDAPADNPS